MANEIAFVPLGEKDMIRLTPETVLSKLCKPTKTGAKPSQYDIWHFLAVCKASKLNPFVGDAILQGYDSEQGPTFSVITTIQALQKRAESHPQYDGMEAGVTVERNGEVIRREGALVLPGENLIGGWCRIYRKDRRHPDFVEVSFSSRNRGNRVWKSDPGGMIVKCAKAAAIRQAFPFVAGQLYIEDEMPQESQPQPQQEAEGAVARLEQRIEEQTPPVAEAATEVEPADPFEQFAQEIKQAQGQERLMALQRALASKELSSEQKQQLKQLASSYPG